MDPANTALGKMLVEEISPVVMVLRTPLVEDSCRKNGLSLIQMVKPFSDFNNIDVPVRTSSDQPYRLRKFRLRLFYESEIRRPNLQVAKDRLKLVITEAGEKEDSEFCADPPQISDVLSGLNSKILPSWFEFFNKELIRSVSFSEHEAFDHPVACLVVVSSKDDQPINRFVDLFNTNKLPSLFNDGAMDPTILKYYLLLHDNQDGPPEKAFKLLTEMKSMFGSNNCKVLCINSAQDGQIVHQKNPWASIASSFQESDGSSGSNLGCLLNDDDQNEMKTLMQELSSKHIIPYMEQKVRLLNQQVSATRKGFRNQIKNLWWRKGKDDAAESANGPMYTFSSIESQIRVLGDYAFILQDYELALSNYRLISTDYKLDKAWKRYAGVQEMIGLTYFMLDQSQKEAEYCMENAFTTYIKMGSSGQQNATRCGLWWIEMLKTRDQHKEAAAVYLRVCSEELLHFAVMLEQASYCYLQCKPPMLYKYGFHLVLSGDHYKKCDQIKHAVRTYRCALSVYKGTMWSYIKDHVHFHIGQWYGFLGMYDVAVEHLLEVVACSHQSKTMQDLFLKEFFRIVQNAEKRFEASRLQLPIISVSSLKVFFEDHRTYASPAAAGVKESVWRSLEEDIIPSLPTSKTNWLELQSKLLPKKYKESNICVAGESIKVDLEFRNPLQIPISVSSIVLICELSAGSDEMGSDANSSVTEASGDEDCRKLGETTDRSLFTLSEVELLLGGEEAKLVQLAVTPHVEGTLNIIGVRWKLSGSASGRYNFQLNLVKKKLGKGKGNSQRSLSNELKFVVIKTLPKLEGTIEGLPTKIYDGALQQLVLRLKNPTEFPVKNLKMKINLPRFLIIGNQKDLALEIPSCLEKKEGSPQNHALATSEKISQSMFLFPEDISIQGEAPLLWPLWFRAAAPGNISLCMVIYYEMGDISGVMKYRFLRMHFSFQVWPSLDVSFKVSPCPSTFQEFLVRMDLINKTTSESFQIKQLSYLGQDWEMSLLQPVDAIFPSQTLVVGQALCCFFKLKRCRKPVASQEHQLPVSNLYGGDVKMTPEDGKQPTFDISCSPLFDFHKCERSLHGRSGQDGATTVDFILISELLQNSSGIPSTPNFFSHHTCHCSTASMSLISWVVNGPKTMHHNFSSSFSHINLRMTIYNSSDAILSVIIRAHDSPSSSHSSDVAAGTSRFRAGWHEAPLVNDIKVTSSPLGLHAGKSHSSESISPFIWTGASSTRVELDPTSSTEIPLQICVFSPGVYDLSNYVLNWKLLLESDGANWDDTRPTSGTCEGYPFYLAVLHSD